MRSSDSIIAGNYPVIEDWISPRASVLDLGCGDGSLLQALAVTKRIRGTGVEISQDMVIECLKKGVSVQQADIDRDLGDWPGKSFDYVILSSTIQVIRRPMYVLKEMLRIGRHAIVTVSNFAYIRNRFSIFFRGRMSSLLRLAESWNTTPAIRFVSLNEFCRSLDGMNIVIEDARFFLPFDTITASRPPLENLFVREAIFRLGKCT